MTIPQQKMREIQFQLLYSLDMANQEEESLKSLLAKELKISKKGIEEARLRVVQIQEKKEILDNHIVTYALSYAFDRIPSVERNILRLGIFELLFVATIPPKVAIAEAIRLARKFSSPESANFINAVMDAIYKELGKKSELSTATPSQPLVENSPLMNQNRDAGNIENTTSNDMKKNLSERLFNESFNLKTGISWADPFSPVTSS